MVPGNALRIREQPTPRELVRAREVFSRYFDVKPGNGPKAATVLPSSDQMEIARSLKRIRLNPPGARFRTRCADAMDTIVFSALVFLAPTAVTGWLCGTYQSSFPPGHAPNPLPFIISGIIGLKLSVRLFECAYKILREEARNIRNRMVSSLACDALLSGYVTDPVAQKETVSVLYAKRENIGSESRYFHPSTSRKIRKILSYDILGPDLAGSLADSID